MRDYLPQMYKRSVFEINYDLLKQKGIKCLVFDLDNTLAILKEKRPNQKVQALITKLKQDFEVVIISNGLKYRVAPFGLALEIEYYPFALKPLTHMLKQVLKKNQLPKEAVAFIGDQLMTDIALGNKMGIMTIFVDPLEKKDFTITSLNRYREEKMIKKYQALGLFKRGEYYDGR